MVTEKQDPIWKISQVVVVAAAVLELLPLQLLWDVAGIFLNRSRTSGNT